MAYNRRKVVAGLASTMLAWPLAGVSGQEGALQVDEMVPGDFTWHPERQPAGPVAVVVSIPQQLVHVYRNGVRIAVSTCSTGKQGHSTPRGVFVVLQKDKDHHSSTYNNAPMPNMNRLTWSGIALHAGDLPGYPASHGCVRLPLEFSELLFEITHLGTPVIIADDHGDPWELTHPGMVLADSAARAMYDAESALEEKGAAKDWVEAATHPVATVLASSADHVVQLISNGVVIAKSALSIRGGRLLGSNVLILNGVEQGTLEWLAITHGDENWDSALPDDQVLARLRTETPFLSQMTNHMHSGMMFVTTDLPLHPDTRSGRDFVIMS